MNWNYYINFETQQGLVVLVKFTLINPASLSKLLDSVHNKSVWT